MATTGITKGKSGLVRSDASSMLMNCMFDSIVNKTVLFVGLLYLWTEFAWPNVASTDLIQAAARPSANKAVEMVGWSFVAFGILILLFGGIASVHVMTLSDIATQVRLLHTLRLLLMSTAIVVAHEVYVLLMGAPKLPVMRISVVLDALNLPADTPLVDFLKPVTLPWLLLAFGSIRLKHFRDSTDLSTRSCRILQGCLLFIVLMAGGLVVAPMSCAHFMLPLEIIGVFMEPLMLLFLIVSTNRLHLHHRYVQLATYGLAALVVAHVPVTMLYLSSVHPDQAVDAHAWAHLATSIRHALVSFILPMVLFVGDLGVNQLQSEVETQSMRNQLQLRFFRWLMHEQRSPLNDISISLSLAQDSVQEMRDLVPAALPDVATASFDAKARGSAPSTKQPAAGRPLVRTSSAGSDGMLSPEDREGPPAEQAKALAAAALSYVDESFDGVKRLQRVMHQVRDFGALVLSHTGFEGAAMPFELHDMLTRTARRFEALAARKKQVLHWRPLRLDANMATSEYSSIPTGEYASLDASGQPRPAVWVTADVVRLRSAIQNIVANAIKFTPKGKSIWVGSNVSLETAAGQRRRLQRGAAAVQDLTLRPMKQSCKQANTSCAKAQKVVGHCEVAQAVWGALSREEAAAPIEGGGDAQLEGGGGRMYALWTTIVEDDGRGIPEALQSNMWNPFSTLVPHENGQNQGGSGLSLIIARAVVEKHGGSLHVFSEGPGEGTRVVMQVSVPVHKGRPAELADMGASYSIEPEIAQWASGGGSSGDGSSSSDSSSNGPGMGRLDASAGVPPSGASQGGGSASGSNPRTGSTGSATPQSQGGGKRLTHQGRGYGALHGTWGEQGTKAGTVRDVGDAELLTQLGLPAQEEPASGSDGVCSPRDNASSGSGSDAEEVQPVQPDAPTATGGASNDAPASGATQDAAAAAGTAQRDEETTIDAAGQASEAAAAHIAPDGLPIIPEGVAAGGAGAHAPSSRLPLRILCVDDAKTTRTLLRKLLKKRTQAEAIDVAENGQVAVDAVAAKGVGYYSLILMDKEMPVMDGYEAARSIRAMGYRRTMLGVTGNALLADVAEFKRHGVCRVLTKPVDAAVLAKWAEFSTHYEHADVHTAD